MCEPVYGADGEVIGIQCEGARGHRGDPGPTGFQGEPEPEAPWFAYCLGCGVEMLVPNHIAWPERCPNGCSPVAVSSVPPLAGFSEIHMWSQGVDP